MFPRIKLFFYQLLFVSVTVFFFFGKTFEIPFKHRLKLPSFRFVFLRASSFFISFPELWLFIYIIMSYHRAHRKQIRIMLISLSFSKLPSFRLSPRSSFFLFFLFVQIKRNPKWILFFCFVTIPWAHFLSSSFFWCVLLPLHVCLYFRKWSCLSFVEDRVNEGFIFP